MDRPRRKLSAELCALALIIVCVLGTLGTMILIHSRGPRPQIPIPKPVVVTRPSAPPPPKTPEPAPKPLPPPPPPKVAAVAVPEDPTKKIVAELAAAEEEQRVETQRAETQTAALLRATEAARAESEKWKRGLTLTKSQLAARGEEATAKEREAGRAQIERDVLVKKRDAVKQSLQDAANRPSYAVLPHKGPNGTWKRPIVIECKDESVTMQPKGPRWELSDLVYNFTTGLPPFVNTISREAIRIQRGNGPDGEDVVPYIFFIVRPSGIRAYYEARTRLERLGIAFGYELADPEWEIDFPDLDNPRVWDGSPPPDNHAGQELAFNSGSSRGGGGGNGDGPGAGDQPGGAPGAKGEGGGSRDDGDNAFRWPKTPPGVNTRGRGGAGTGVPFDLGDAPGGGPGNGLNLTPPSGYGGLPGRTPRGAPGNGNGDGNGDGEAPGSMLGGGSPGRFLARNDPGNGTGSGYRNGLASGYGRGSDAGDGTGSSELNGDGDGDRLAPTYSGGGAYNEAWERALRTAPGGIPARGLPNGTGSAGPWMRGEAAGNADEGCGPGGMGEPGKYYPPGGFARQAATNGGVGLSDVTGGLNGGSGDVPNGSNASGMTGSGRASGAMGAGAGSQGGNGNLGGSGAGTGATVGSGETGGTGGLSGSSGSSAAGGTNGSGSPGNPGTSAEGGQPGGPGSPGGASGSSNANPSGVGKPGMPGDPAGGSSGLAGGLSPVGRSLRPLEFVVSCGPKGVAIHPGNYRVTTASLKAKDSLLVAQLRAILRLKEQTNTEGGTLVPSIRYVIEPGGHETYATAKSQVTFSELNWPATVQMIGGDKPRVFQSETW